MALTEKQQMMIDRRVDENKKSKIIAYLLLIFLGGLGSHRFYINGPSAGAFGMLAIAIVAISMYMIDADKAGDMLMIVLVVWQIVDLFLIPGMIRKRSEKLRKDLEYDALIRT